MPTRHDPPHQDRPRMRSPEDTNLRLRRYLYAVAVSTHCPLPAELVMRTTPPLKLSNLTHLTGFFFLHLTYNPGQSTPCNVYRGLELFSGESCWLLSDAGGRWGGLSLGASVSRSVYRDSQELYV